VKEEVREKGKRERERDRGMRVMMDLIEGPPEGGGEVLADVLQHMLLLDRALSVPLYLCLHSRQ
jgi:hypothetical protein